ncbi:MAG: TrkA family potassium uptake protein, partial [Candidatus Aminicenantes bacterium]|nr:TrkA family potassium uptake protein [Candidatus Aminicenantes bacterium]
HYIICGHGRIGQIVRERMEEEKTRFVIVDNDPEIISDLRTAGTCLFLEGDATHEDVLLKAGIKKAKGLASLLPSDADNLYLVLTSKQINPSLFILAKAMDEDAEKKILQIGANKVFSPYKISGLRIAQSLLRPTLVDFMDLVIRRQEISLNMEEFTLIKGCRVSGLSLRESDIRKHANVIVVAIKKPGKDILFNPSSDKIMESGDTLLVMGNEEAILTFEHYIKECAP